MKAAALAALLVHILSIGALAALHQADPAAVAAIADKIRRVKEIEIKPGDPSTIDALQLSIKNESKKIDKNDAKVEIWQEQIERLRAQRSRLCQEIIKDVEQAYGIEPDHWSAPLATGGPDGAFLGVRADWNPKFVELAATQDTKRGPVIHYEKTGLDNEIHAFDYPLIVRNGKPIMPAGVTWASGEINIGLDAFMDPKDGSPRSPGYLGAVILHETVHFNQRTTPGIKMTDYDAEVGAFGVMLDRKNAAMLGLTADEITDIETVKKSELQDVLENNGRFLLSSPIAVEKGGAVGSPEAIKAGGADDFFANVAKIPAISKQAYDAYNNQEAVARREWESSPQYRDYIESERRRMEEERQQAVQRANEDLSAFAASHGFYVYLRHGSRGPVDGIQSKEGRILYFLREMPRTNDQYKVAFALARGCMEIAAGSDGQSAGDALSTMREHWGDAGFRDGLYFGNNSPLYHPELDTSDTVHRCLFFVVNKIEPPFDSEKFYRVLFAFKKILADEGKKEAERQKKWLKEHPPGKRSCWSGGRWWPPGTNCGANPSGGTRGPQRRDPPDPPWNPRCQDYDLCGHFH